MNIKEMHIAIGVEMNKINSALFENIIPEEIDFAINTNIQRFVKQRYGPDANLKRKGFEMSEKRIDDLRTLLATPSYTNKAYIPLSYDPGVNEKVNFYFPGDYMLAVASRFRTSDNYCGTFTYTTGTETISYTKFDVTLGTTWGVLRLKNVTDGFVLNLTTAADVYNKTDDLTYISRIILQKLRDQYNFSQYEFYWERFQEIYVPNNIIIVNKSATTWATSIDSGVTYTNISNNTVDRTYYTNTPNATTSGKLVEEDDIYAMQPDPFNKTVVDFPLYFASDSLYNVYIDRNLFVVTNGILSYIRNPRTVSYYLSQDCNLPEHTHSEIVSMTVDYLLEAVQAGERYKTHQEIVATNE